MFFTKTKPSPVEVDIDGAKYKLPRYLAPQMIEHADQLRKKEDDAATAHMTAEEKGKFLMFYASPPKDIAIIRDWVGSPEGACKVVKYAMVSAGIPEAEADDIVAAADTMNLRTLATALASASNASAQLVADAGGKGSDPLAGQKPS